MSGAARLQPPANDPPIADGGQHSQAWSGYFQNVADTLAVLPTQMRQGVVDGSDATAGQIGEYLTASGSIGLASATYADAAVLALTAGDWDVWGVAEFVADAGAVSFNITASVSAVSASPSGVLTFLPYSAPAGSIAQIPTGTGRFSAAAAGSVYLVVVATFTGSGMTVNGTINARRAR